MRTDSLLRGIARLLFAGCLSLFASIALAKGPELVFDLSDGRVLIEREAQKPWYPASLTKLMTLHVALGAVSRGQVTMDSPVVLSPAALSVSPTLSGFPEGTRMTLETALSILMVKSANDVAVAVAEAVSGNEETFVEVMNMESRRLGMSSSNWTNPHGLSDRNQHTTARDLALLIADLLASFPSAARLVSLHGYEIGGRVTKSHNGLLGRVRGADGLKTGYTCASGWNIAASATREGQTLVAIVLGELDDLARDAEAAHLLESGFAMGKATGQRLEDLPALKAAPTDMRPYVCGGKRESAAGDAEPGIEKARANWIRTFKAMPRALDAPLHLDLLPEEETAPVPLPRDRIDAIRSAASQDLASPAITAPPIEPRPIRRF